MGVGCVADFSELLQAGWDPVTGAGTPNFGKLKDYVRSLP